MLATFVNGLLDVTFITPHFWYDTVLDPDISVVLLNHGNDGGGSVEMMVVEVEMMVVEVEMRWWKWK
jgi:hypothetical protein